MAAALWREEGPALKAPVLLRAWRQLSAKAPHMTGRRLAKELRAHVAVFVDTSGVSAARQSSRRMSLIVNVANKGEQSEGRKP